MKNKLVSIFVIVISLLCIHSVAYAVEDDGSSNLTWTDFSKAKFEVTKKSHTVDLSISNVTPYIGNSYYYVITAKNTKPSINFGLDEIRSDTIHPLSFSLPADITSYVELNQDLYLWIIERQFDEGVKYKYLVEGKKLERPEYPIYSDVFTSTMITNTDTQILFNVPWSDNHSRTINLKIGKIDDVTILNKMKNKENDAFQKLLEYSKKADTIYNQQLTSTKRNNTYEHGYKDSLDLRNLIQDGSFYFMYAQLDDENGKYYPVEGITYAKADVYDDSWYLMFLCSMDNWNAPQNSTTTTKPTTTKPTATTPTASTKDTTVAKTAIPFAGNKAFIIFMIVTTLITLAVIGKVQYNKYKDIK